MIFLSVGTAMELSSWHPIIYAGSPEEIAEQFVLYITDRFGREEFKDEVEDFGNVFGH